MLVLFFMLLCVWSLYCNLVLIVLFSVSIISLKLKELVVLLLFCIYCRACDCILLAVPWDYKKTIMCEGGIDKSDPRITDWHQYACRVMADGDHEGRIFLSHPHTNNGFIFLLTTHFILERHETIS